jgi:hypothetical protein
VGRRRSTCSSLPARVSISASANGTAGTGIRNWLASQGPAGLRYGEVNDRIQHDIVDRGCRRRPDGARRRGLELGMLGENNAKAWWTLGRFDNFYVKTRRVWRIAHMRQAQWLRTDYDKGWAKDWQPLSPALENQRRSGRSSAAAAPRRSAA